MNMRLTIFLSSGKASVTIEAQISDDKCQKNLLYLILSYTHNSLFMKTGQLIQLPYYCQTRVAKATYQTLWFD